MKLRKILLTFLFLFIPAAIINLVPLGGIPTAILYGIFFYLIKLVWSNSDSESSASVKKIENSFVAEESSALSENINVKNSSKTQHSSFRPIGLLVGFNIILIVVVAFSLYNNYQLNSTIKLQYEHILELNKTLEELSSDIDHVNEIIGANFTNAYGDSYLEYRLKRIEKQLGLGNGELLNSNGETVEEWRARKNSD